MRILVTGCKGQLGYDVVKVLSARGHEVLETDVDSLDITDENAVKEYFENNRPQGVVHCAAWTAVDLAEEEQNKPTVQKINAYGTQLLAQQCKKYDAKMLYVSTDYVFDGQGEEPWKPYDEACPLNYYGQTKYEGEQAVLRNVSKHFIVRISWVFGVNGKNFIKTMLTVGKKNNVLNVVNDQTGSPTYTAHLAVLLADMVESEKYGIYHATNEGYCTWYEFAVEIFNRAKAYDSDYEKVRVNPVTSEQFVQKAKRPTNSRMDKSELDKNGFLRLASWQEALQEYLEILLAK